MKNKVKKIIYSLFPLKTYGYYFCNCNNFHYGWYQKKYGNDGWYLITKQDRSICKENNRIYKALIKQYCLPEFKPKYEWHKLKNDVCIRCGKNFK